jgi:hypothetical protein
MAIKQYSKLSAYPGYYYETYYNDSVNSSKVGGKLVLKAHPHQFTLNRLTAYGSSFAGNDCAGATSVPFPWTSEHNNAVYAKFVGQLRKGSASMGVNFASWQQSADMIVSRCEKLKDFFDLKRVSRRKSRRRPKQDDRFSRKALASDILEGEFGWVPLLQDIHACLTTVCGENAVPSTWVRASSKFSHSKYTEQIAGFNPRSTESVTGSGRITYAASVAVTNPNLWLLNRLGLINPLTVAWDLVPWSFVVNMFVNVNSVLSSLTDTVGLTISDGSYTRSSSLLSEQRRWWHSGVANNRTSFQNCLSKQKTRTTGALVPPSLAFKAPRLDWNLAVIASALVVQKVKALH